MEIAKIIEKKRTASTTLMNDASSRSHALVELKMYKKDGDNFHVNFMRFIDLAGSERFAKTGASNRKVDMMLLEAIMTNYSLTVLARVVGNIASLKKPLTGGEVIPNSTQWKEVAITRVLRSSFDGSAFTCFIIAVSQAQRNGGESWCSMQFAERCSKLRAYVTKPKPQNIAATIKKYEGTIVADTHTLINLRSSPRMDPNAITFRGQMIEYAQTMIEILSQLL